MDLLMIRKSIWIIALLFAAIIAPNAHATGTSVTFTTVAGSDSDGPLDATVEFSPVSGGIELIVTNTEASFSKRGQSVSALSFTVNGLNTPTGFTQLTGAKIDSASF